MQCILGSGPVLRRLPNDRAQTFRFAAVMLAAVAPAFAQTKAKAQNVPEIPYDSVPNFLKLPPNLYLGEGIGVATNSKGHVFVYTRSQDTRLFEFDQNGNFVREIGEGLYGFMFAHAVRVDPEDNIWAVDEGSNMVIKFNPEGRVVMVLGRRPEAVDGLRADAGHGPAPPPTSRTRSAARPTSAWDAAGQHLRLRRLRQLARREVRQERPLHQVGRHARQRARASSTCRTRSRRTPRATSTSATAATRAFRCSTTT